MKLERLRHAINDKIDSNVALSATALNASFGEYRDQPKVGPYIVALTVTAIGMIYMRNRLIRASNRREVKNNV